MSDGNRGAFDELADFLYRQYIEPLAISATLARFSLSGEFQYITSRLLGGLRRLNFAESEITNGADPMETIRPDAMLQAMRDVDSGVGYARQLLGGVAEPFIETVEDHYNVIAGGIEPTDFPQHDMEAMRLAGVPNPSQQARAVVYKIKSRRMRQEAQQRRIGRSWAEASDVTGQHGQRLRVATDRARQANDEPPKVEVKPHVVRGFNAFGQGGLLILTDLDLARQTIGAPTAGPLAAVGIIASIVGGLVQVADGSDYLKRE